MHTNKNHTFAWKSILKTVMVKLQLYLRQLMSEYFYP